MNKSIQEKETTEEVIQICQPDSRVRTNRKITSPRKRNSDEIIEVYQPDSIIETTRKITSARKNYTNVIVEVHQPYCSLPTDQPAMNTKSNHKKAPKESDPRKRDAWAWSLSMVNLSTFAWNDLSTQIEIDVLAGTAKVTEVKPKKRSRSSSNILMPTEIETSLFEIRLAVAPTARATSTPRAPSELPARRGSQGRNVSERQELTSPTQDTPLNLVTSGNENVNREVADASGRIISGWL